jgi:hypothetical protein
MARSASFSYKFFRPLVLFIVFPIVLSACSDNNSPEGQVRQYVASAVTAAESREALAIRKLISDKYKDESRRDRRRLVGLALGYFLRNKNIHLFTQISEITFPVPEQARVKLYAAMTGSPVVGAQALLDIRADLYQFDLMLIRDGGEWLLESASWRRANIENIVGGE